MKKLLYMIFMLCMLGSLNAAHKYNLSIGAIFRDEAPYLKEWIEFHRLVGVDHFYLYNNGSRDNFRKVLKPYITRGIVELIDWSYMDDTHQGFCLKVQPEAYEDCIHRARSVSKWVALIDTDEFLTPITANSVNSVLREYKEFGGVFINWQMFGTSGHKAMPPHKTSIEVFIMKAAPDHPNHQMGKSIVRPECVLDLDNPHNVNFKSDFFCVDGNKNRIDQSPYGYNHVGPCLDKLVLNHYWSRTEEYCYIKKFKQYQRWHSALTLEDLMAYVNQMNLVRDTTMERFVTRLRAKMKFSPTRE